MDTVSVMDSDDDSSYEPPEEVDDGDVGERLVPGVGAYAVVESGWLGRRPSPSRGRPRWTTLVLLAMWIGTLVLYLWLQRGG